MNVYVHEINGIADAIISMHMSKRNWTKELEDEIYRVCDSVTDRRGKLQTSADAGDLAKFSEWFNKLLKWGTKHITLLKFIDISITVEGLHRGGQDDWDSHAKRFDNRIIRSSTRLATFGCEKSEYYKDKILTTDEAIQVLGMTLPLELSIEGVEYVKTVNGYVRADCENSQDAKRGLYMLSIPSNFVFRCNLAEFAHVYKERNDSGSANPEVKLCCEVIVDQLSEFHKQLNRDLLQKINN